jgi:glycosyltransferase involved in cell wall biosynthesis
MRVAFEVIGGEDWTGGFHYLVNLLSAIAELPAKPIEPILFTGLDIDKGMLQKITPYLSEPPMQSQAWTCGSLAHRSRLFQVLVLQRDTLAERTFRRAGVDLVFQHARWYGFRFPLATLAWLGDLQHRHLPTMFGWKRYWRREIGLRLLTRFATTILVMSENAKLDCERFYPWARGKIASLPFASLIPAEVWKLSPAQIREKYGLPERFFFLPSQFWRHKNHMGVIRALELLKRRGIKIVVAACGNLRDGRDPEYPKRVLVAIKQAGVENEFRVLGMIPYLDLLALMRASVAVINPSFYEGWSTTVEEAKSLGVPLLLSAIPTHREQAPPCCGYFDPHDTTSLADTLNMAWKEWDLGPHYELEKLSAAYLPEWRGAFGHGFLNIAAKTLEAAQNGRHY